MVKQCNDGYLYDIVIYSWHKHKYESLENVRIRYLNYINYGISNGHIIELTFSHPGDLVSASLNYVTILNMNQCVNLKNLFS